MQKKRWQVVRKGKKSKTVAPESLLKPSSDNVGFSVPADTNHTEGTDGFYVWE